MSRGVLQAARSQASPLFRRELLGAGALLLAGCGLMGPAKSARVSGSIQAAATLNPSVSQRPSPLRVLIYELKSAAAFGKADFMSLYQSDQTALGSEFVAREEFVLQPGESRSYARTLAPETRFLGVLAVYRDLERATWRAVAPVQPGRAHKLLLRADSLAISLHLEA